jgi:Phthiocerol/phthiodiolone dimycocerosyl transferase C-terminus/Condensation domain
VPMRRELGIFETAATFTNRHARFVVAVALRLEGGPSPERLGAALAVLQRRHPLLGVRIVERAGRFWFESEGTPPIPLRLAERAGEEGWIGVVEGELNRRFDPTAGPLLRCTYLTPPGPTTGDRRCEIVLTFHHAVMDAASGATLLGELLRLCDPAGDPRPDEAAAVGPASAAPPPVERLFPPAWRGPRRRWRLAGFLARQLADELAYRFRTRGRPRASIPRETRCRILPVELPAAPTSGLTQATRRRRVTVNAALVAALLMATGKHLYGDGAAALRYFTVADLRPYLAPPVTAEALGAYIAMLRYTARLRPGAGFWELAGAVSRQVAAGARRGDKFAAVWMSEWVMRTLFRRGSERMATAAVSYSGVTRLESRYGAIGVRGMHGFVSNFGLGPEYTAQARIFDGRLQLDVVYLDADMDRPRAQAIAGEIVDILHTAAESE